MDALVFSSLWVGLIAAGLTRAAAGAIPGAVSGWTPVIAACGAVAVYSIDRLRDVERDRSTRPARSTFIDRQRPKLLALTGVAACAAAWGVFLSGSRVFLLCAAILALGLLHRRLKRVPLVKWSYVTTAWVAITIGLPVLADGATIAEPRLEAMAWPIVVFALTIGGNLVASDLRPGIDPFSRSSGRRGLWIARSMVALAVVGALLSPAPAWTLLWIPLAELVCLARFRRDERYGLVVVDGALLVGALLAIATQHALMTRAVGL